MNQYPHVHSTHLPIGAIRILEKTTAGDQCQEGDHRTAAVHLKKALVKWDFTKKP